jgi:DNA methyltransferase 1-associated protein 1
MQRELYSLLGENTPPIVLTQNKFRDKPTLKAAPWNWVKFKNQARDDGLVLHHWVRGQHVPDEEYAFAKYNQKVKVPEFTEEQYNEALHGMCVFAKCGQHL